MAQFAVRVKCLLFLFQVSFFLAKVLGDHSAMDHLNKGVHNMTKTPAAFTFLQEGDHVVIIYSALKRLGIAPSDDRYEDFVQDGWLLFLSIYDKFPDNPATNRRQLLSYDHQALYHRFLNAIQKQQRRDRMNEDDADGLVALAEEGDSFAAIEDEMILNELHGRLSDAAGRYLIDTVKHHLTPTEIAKKYGVSRPTVYKWRREVRDQFK